MNVKILDHIGETLKSKNHCSFLIETSKESNKFDEISEHIHQTKDVNDHFFILNSNEENKLDIKVLRDLQKKLNLRTENNKQICLINNIDTVSIPCLNAFLKILEEPPLNVFFILVTSNPSKILPTIKSRCHSFYIGESNPIVENNLLSDLIINKPESFYSEEKKLEISKDELKKTFKNLNNHIKEKFSYGEISTLEYKNILIKLNELETQTNNNVNLKSVLFSLVLQFIDIRDRMNSNK